MITTEKLVCLFTLVAVACLGVCLYLLATGKQSLDDPGTTRSHADAQPTVKPSPVVEPVEPEPTPEPVVEPQEPVIEPQEPVEPEPAIPPACCKECDGFGMDRPNCLAPDCHCGDDCRCAEGEACCDGCLCAHEAEPADEPNFKHLHDLLLKCGCRPGCSCGEKCNCQPGYNVCGLTCNCAGVAIQYICETCRGVIYVGAKDKTTALPAYQCYRCPANPDGRKPLMHRTDSPRRQAPQRTNWQPAWEPRFRPFGGFGGFGSGGGFGTTLNGQWCAGST